MTTHRSRARNHPGWLAGVLLAAAPGCALIDAASGDGADGAATCGMRFSTENVSGTGPSANDVGIADLDSDGAPDLIAATSSGAMVAWGLGGGAFAPGQPIGSQRVVTLAIADLDGDGLLDLAATTSGTEVRLLHNLGGRGFAEVVLVATSGSPSAIAAGRTWLAVGQRSSPTLDVWDQPLGAATATTLTVDGGPQVLAAGDIDGDGDDDVIVSANGVLQARLHPERTEIRSLHGDSGGTLFAVGVGELSPVADAVADLVYAEASPTGPNHLGAVLLDPAGVTNDRQFGQGQVARQVAIGDLDGDGVGDVAALLESGQSLLWVVTDPLEDPCEGALDGDGFPTRFAIGDLDGDGRADLVYPDSRGGLTVRRSR